MNDEIKQRLTWVKLYEQTQDAGLVRCRCGISRPTLRKWWRRYQEHGEAGRRDLSRRPHQSPKGNVFEQDEQRILELRRTRHLGAHRIQHELRCLYNCDLGQQPYRKCCSSTAHHR